jgi:hypothetical protein
MVRLAVEYPITAISPRKPHCTLYRVLGTWYLVLIRDRLAFNGLLVRSSPLPSGAVNKYLNQITYFLLLATCAWFCFPRQLPLKTGVGRRLFHKGLKRISILTQKRWQALKHFHPSLAAFPFCSYNELLFRTSF